MCCVVFCCAVLCCDVLCVVLCVVLYCIVLCCVVLCCVFLCCIALSVKQELYRMVYYKNDNIHVHTVLYVHTYILYFTYIRTCMQYFSRTKGLRIYNSLSLKCGCGSSYHGNPVVVAIQA